MPDGQDAGTAPLFGRWTWILGAIVLAFELAGKLTDGGVPSSSRVVEVAISVGILAVLRRRTERLRGRAPTRLLHLWKPWEVVVASVLVSIPFWILLAMVVRGGRGDTVVYVALAALALLLPLVLLLRLRWEFENPETVPIMETPPARYALEPLHATWQGRSAIAFAAVGSGWIVAERVAAAVKLPAERAWLGWLNVGAWCAFLAFGVVGAMVMARRRARVWREEFERAEGT